MKIRNLKQLAEHVESDLPTVASIRNRLYKDTECGVGFSADEQGVVVAGYCEGVDVEPPGHRLTWGFTADEFDAVVKLADQDGCELWDKTHGCPDCNTEEIDGCKTVDPDCKSCQGGGMII